MPISDPDRATFDAKLANAAVAWQKSQSNTYVGRLPTAEKEAHAISDPINPQYAYQLCGANL